MVIDDGKDHAVCVIDGIEVAWLDGEKDWRNVALFVKGAGEHTLEWRYIKEEADDGVYPGEDCTWVCDVSWLPGASQPVFADVSDLVTVFSRDSEVTRNVTDASQLAAFNAFLWACGVTSAASIGDAQKRYAYQSFRLSEIMAEPQLFESEPVLRISAFEALGEGFALTISLIAGGSEIALAKDALKRRIRVGFTPDAVVDPLKDGDIITAPSEDGASLTFTVKPPNGNHAFMKVKLD